MSIKSLNELEREKKNKIKSLKPDEAEYYINSLNKRMVDAMGNVDNQFNMDVKTILETAALCDEAIDLLSDKYQMRLAVASSRVNALVEKHQADIRDMKNLFLEIRLDDFMKTYFITGTFIFMLEGFLAILYNHYWTSPAIIESYLDMTDEDESCIDSISWKLNDIPVYDLYNQKLMDDITYQVKLYSSIMDNHVNRLRKLVDFDFKDPEVKTNSYYDIFRDGMLEYKEKSYELLERYDNMMEDGFYYSKQIEAKVVSELLDKDMDKLLETFMVNRPSYDLKNNVFIPPEHHIKRMAEVSDDDSSGD